MPVKYQPLGIPVTSSFSERARGAITASNLPATASFAQVTTDVAFTGPTGPSFRTITGSIVPLNP
jgi:hypothetical protein